MYECLCACSNTHIACYQQLKESKTQSCGCLRKEITGNNKRTHGATNTKEYKTWKAIKHRCLNSNASDYSYYGGRGIRICERWLNSFENFFEDMGTKPKGFTIERVENDRDYGPSNCVWADRKTQAQNRRPRTSWRSLKKT